MESLDRIEALKAKLAEREAELEAMKEAELDAAIERSLYDD